MSTTTPTGSHPQGYTPQTSEGSNFGRDARGQKKSKPTGWIVATFGAAALAMVGMIAAVFLAFAGPATAGASSTVEHHRSDSHHAVIINGGGHSHHTVQPSAQIETLQKDLGQLNYYEGPVNGYPSVQLEQSIKYLQADAGLPQTGRMDAPTQAAMQNMLINGNNQMGS
ncbi:MAG TPA: peptidoglycan-binding domain-containing protein [Microlunatus sp.]